MYGKGFVESLAESVLRTIRSAQTKITRPVKLVHPSSLPTPHVSLSPTVMTDHAPRYTSLRDYLRLLREQRLNIVLITMVAGGTPLFVVAQQKPPYWLAQPWRSPTSLRAL